MSSYRDGGFDPFFFEKIRSNRTISITTIHRMVFTFLRSHFKSIYLLFYGNLYNYYPSNGFHIFALTFYVNLYIFYFVVSQSFYMVQMHFFHCVTFSEKPEVDDVIHKGLSRGMSHQIAIVIR